MNKDQAQHLVRVAFRSGRELEDVLGVLKAACEPDEYWDFATGIAAAIDAVHLRAASLNAPGSDEEE